MKIAIITSTRAEYGLLCPLIRQLIKDEYFNVHVLVTGTHLLYKYGRTIDYIKEDNIPINYEVSIMAEDSHSIGDIIAQAIIKFDEIFRLEKYDAVLVLGDRYELYGFCIPALLNNIPIIHLHGGEKSEGAIDERIRHSITKLASIHFPSIAENAKRIIQMGENPKYVFPVGALGIDNILSLDYMTQPELEQDLGVVLKGKHLAIVTFHPMTLADEDEISKQVVEVFDALLVSDLYCIVTMPNSDQGGQIVFEMIKTYARQYPHKFLFVKSLGQKRYLSLLNICDLVIGNSSSGIIEAPSFCIPTIDIGDRQKGRYAPKTVIHCNCIKEDILKSINKARSTEFKQFIKDYVNPYGDGHTAQKISDVLKKIDLRCDEIIQKRFIDMEI